MKLDKNKLIGNALKSWRVPSECGPDESWEAIQNKISKRNERVVSMRKWLSISGAVAAGLAILIWFGLDSSDVRTVGSAFVMEESDLLPDGSSYILNGASELSFDMSNWEGHRSLSLNGEAYFEVEKGSPFMVETPNGTVQVLGTTFNVLSRGQKMEVECYSGKVRVVNEVAEFVLTPGHGVKWSHDGWMEYSVSESNPDWKMGTFHFTDTPVREVFDELEWQIGMEIISPDLEGLYFEGVFDVVDIESALGTVCLPLGLEFKVDWDALQVTVSKHS